MKTVFLLVASAYLVITSAVAAPATIRGKALHLAGQEVRLFTIYDYFTETRTLLSTVEVNDQGAFVLQHEPRNTTYGILVANGLEYTLFLEPGQTYDVEILSEPDLPLAFTGTIDTNELNFAIGRFNYDFSRFMAESYELFLQGRLREPALKFIDSVKLAYANIISPYFKDYIEYRLATLEYSAGTKGPKKLFETYLYNRPVLYDNTEYVYFFTQYYDKFLFDMKFREQHEKVNSIMRMGSGYAQLVTYLSGSGYVRSAEIAEPIAAYNILQAYYSGKYKREHLVSLLQEGLMHQKNPVLAGILQNMIHIITRLQNGSTAPALTGKNTEAEVHSLADLQGKPVYLSFFNPEEPASILEITAIKPLYDKYKKDMHFVTVCSSCSYSQLQQFIDQNKLKWNFWIISGEAEQQFELASYPAFFIIDKAGVFFSSPSKSPSENAEDLIYDITKKAKTGR